MNDGLDMFGVPPPMAPYDTVLYRHDPSLYDVVRAINDQGELSREQRENEVAHLIEAQHKAPDLRLGSILGTGLGGIAGYLLAKHLTNASHKGQMAAGAGGATLGALIGNALQVMRSHEQ